MENEDKGRERKTHKQRAYYVVSDSNMMCGERFPRAGAFASGPPGEGPTRETIASTEAGEP